MSYQEILAHQTIAISISESPDMPALGLSEGHLHDAMAEIARHLLALGAQLVYGGDLRLNGFSTLLFELVARHRRDVEDGENGTGVTSYLAWPVHIQSEFGWLEQISCDLEGSARIVCLGQDGSQLGMAERQAFNSRQPSDIEWATGLTTMRHVMLANSQARIALGGRVDKYKGAMPGIAEEALLALQSRQPLYLLGGFGGAARDISETLGLVDPWAGSRGEWPGRPEFSRFSGKDLNNGLTAEENRTLAKTPHVDQAVTLILRGLSRAARGEAS
jgi:hypothetical protein